MRAVTVDADSAPPASSPARSSPTSTRATQAHGLAVPARHQLHHRHRRPDPRRRLRLDQPQVRPDHRQPRRRRRRHRRRRPRPRQRRREPGPLLGDPRRRRQLRRGGGLRVPAAQLGPDVLAGLVVHPIERRPRPPATTSAASAPRPPDELTVWAVLRKAPPAPFVPEEWHGREVLIFAACYAGRIADGEKAMAPARAASASRSST